MLNYLATFIISLVTAGTVMVAFNTGIPEIGIKKKNLFMALGVAVGVTLADVVIDLYHPPYERIVRACIVGGSIGAVLLVFERFIGRVEASSTDGAGNKPNEPNPEDDSSS